MLVIQILTKLIYGTAHCSRLPALLLAVVFIFPTLSCGNGSQPEEAKPKTKAEELAEAEKKERESRQEEIRKQATKIYDRMQTNNGIGNLVDKYNAVIQWEKDLENLKQVFTINIQDALVRKDRRPILLIAPISDIEKENDRYLLHIEVYADVIYHDTITYRYTLECDFDCMNKLNAQLSQHPLTSNDNEYAIIAFISSARKLRFNISAHPYREEAASLDLNTSRDALVNGRCLDLLNIGQGDQ